MARRSLKMKRGKFKVSGLRDVLLQCADMLYKAISKQNPDVDQDDVEDALRALVRQLGAAAPADAAEATASVDDRPEYNLAGDILAIAHEHHQNGDYRTAFKMFATAMDADGIVELMAGIKEMNANTTVADVADAMDDDVDDESENEDEEAIYGDEDDAMDEVVAELEDEDEPALDDVDDGDDEGDAFGADDVMDDPTEVDADFEDDAEEVDDDEPDPALPMAGEATARMRALANKASLNGSTNARQQAVAKFLK